MAQYSKEELEYIINHVTLPLQLPQEAEDEVYVTKAEKALLHMTFSLTQTFYEQSLPEFKSSWLCIRKMLEYCIKTDLCGGVSTELLTDALLDMRPGGKSPNPDAYLPPAYSTDVFPVRIRAQNAAVIFRRLENALTIECFEISPRSVDVMGCKGSLGRSFPAQARAIPLQTATEPKFHHEFFTMLSRLDSEVVEEMMPKSTKAKSTRVEIRDTCHPGLVSEMLMAVLSAVAKPLKIRQIQKRYRDDVLWDNSLLPWRRSTLWLILRVTIQTTLVQDLEPSKVTIQYKNFLIYFQTNLLRLASAADISLDVCKMMQMKIARRVVKLDTSILPFVQEGARLKLKEATQTQEKIWLKVQNKDADRKTRLDVETLENDTTLTLHNARPALDTALQRSESRCHQEITIESSYPEWITFGDHSVALLNSASLSAQSPTERIYALAEFERWVAESLPAWLQQASLCPLPKQCAAIERSAIAYKTMSSKIYKGCPEQSSIMLLTVGEMWQAMDQLAGLLIPLLHQYSPEIPTDIFNVLLLPKKAQMERLHNLEMHISGRYNNSHGRNGFIFADASNANIDCFASRYVEQSAEHQHLRQRIVENATEKQNEKKTEWQSKTNRYNSLVSEVNKLSCAYKLDYRGESQHDRQNCPKCTLDSQRRQITIDVFEWPLPEAEVECRIAVFNLRCPDTFAAWQNLTWMLIHDMGHSEGSPGELPKAFLATYPGLTAYKEISSARIVLASSIKTVASSHYRQLTFPTSVQSVLSEHSLHYKLYDECCHIWICDQTAESSFSTRCQTVLPPGRYKNLQYAVNSTVHTQNQVLADQIDCSPELSLHEFIAFGSLRADGERTQWLNTSRELKAPNLSWNTESVCNLIRQTAWQVGTACTTSLRVAHTIFGIREFAIDLISTSSDMLQAIEANSQCCYALEVLIVLALRTLSLTQEDHVKTHTVKLLQSCRAVAFRWVQGLEASLRTTTDPIEIVSVRRSLLRAAALCKMTFDVDEDSLAQLLTTSEDLMLWTMASMTIQTNTPGASDLLPEDLRRLLLRSTKLSHALYGRVQGLLTTPNNTGLDLAVSRIWSAFQTLAHTWEYLEQQTGRWVCKKTSSGPDVEMQTVFYNILSGELLVDGRPLGSLPKSYTSHPLFLRLLGAQILRVSSSDVAGMLYMTAEEVYGHRMYFTMIGQDLVIRAKHASATLELIANDHFANDIPTILVEDYIHWLDLDTSVVEFRPLCRKWIAENQNWRLIYRPQGKSYLENQDAMLVDIRSRTCQKTVDVLGGLELRSFTHITKSSDDAYTAYLPRLGFHFLRNDSGDLECQELRKIVDPNQSLGAMIGLKSRLVLRANGDRAKELDRVVLIPKGDVSTTREGDHLAVSVTTKGRNVHCFRYQHDAILHRLVGDGSVISRLYQAYLHALTSYILPDPLTSYLGTEQSLKLLEEQVLRCYKPLESAEIDMLNDIAALTPHRVFYPPHLQVMQQVTWHSTLSPLVQHNDFAALAQNIFEHGEQFRMLYQDLSTYPSMKSRGDKALLQRAKIRNSTYMNVDFGGNEWTTDYNVEYEARDSETPSDRSVRVYEISSSVMQWRGDLLVLSQLANRWKSWGRVAGFNEGFDLSQPISELLTLNLASTWGSLYELCRSATREKSVYKLFFLFAQISYGSRVSTLDDLIILLAFATNPTLHGLKPFPDYQAYTLSDGSAPSEDKLESIVKTYVKQYTAPRPNMSKSERKQDYAEYEKLSAANVGTAVTFFMNQWPCSRPAPITASSVKWLRTKDIQQSINSLFAECYKNRLCESHLSVIQGTIQATMTTALDYDYSQSSWQNLCPIPRLVVNKFLPTIPSLMASRSPIIPIPIAPLVHTLETKAPTKNAELRALIMRFGKSQDKRDSTLRARYELDLLASLDAFHDHRETVMPANISHSVKRMISSSFNIYHSCHALELKCLYRRLAPQAMMDELLELAGLWPRRSLCSILGLLASTSSRSVPMTWKEKITIIGSIITFLQRARRLVLAGEKDDVVSLYRETENPGQRGWTARERPDWLLIEIENDFLIRPIQVRVALEMISPTSSSNTLMQLNMGEGKSSVITPLIAATLADTNQLVRVVVLRSLTRQMQDTLVQRLSGLVKRPVYFIPFSRKTAIDELVVQKMQRLYMDCMTNRGVLISQPEHILSFKLMGIERLASAAYPVGLKLLETQGWLDEKSRDVLDESDEILDVKFQVIYTLGSQRSMDGQPDRWVLMQDIFDFVQHRAGQLRLLYPDQIEFEKQTSGSFPVIRLLSPNIRRELIARVGEDVCESKIPGLVMSNLSPEFKKAATSFVVDHDVTDATCRSVQSLCADDSMYLKKLLLVRGLIAHGILLHILHDKRWSVNYGLHPSRCLCAVPYRAKGVPAATAEFGHPDVALGLTCLSYYYTGLTNKQLRICLEMLRKLDDPSSEYTAWTTVDQSFPRNLTHWNSINLEDNQQCEEKLFPALTLNKKVADFFLTYVVFPKEGKEFDQKLSTSGWDIPAKSGSQRITTGFSGTNDNRFLLPSSISQHDLPELKHTSGKVLEILSRPENLCYLCAKNNQGCQLPSEGLLEAITRADPSIRVLIDVGAHILDLSNEQVISRWLGLVEDADAGVYFDENDNAMVVTKTGKMEKLATSSFLSQMDRCIIYLDDVHTRGTDLKLPSNARAAVTLGPRLPKDRLVQACMRLRQLGHGQSLMFVAPPEVHQDILKVTGSTSSTTINGLHVIEWALEQSCLQIERNQPLRVAQGLSYYDRLEILEDLKQTLPSLGENLSGSVTEKLIEYEAQSLEDLYSPEAMREKTDRNLVRGGRLRSDPAVQELVDMMDKLDPTVSRGANMHEELEREVAHEVEQETQIERPPKARAETPRLDRRVEDFIRQGTAYAISYFMTVWGGVLSKCSATLLQRAQKRKPWKHLRVSNDFIRTAECDQLSVSDDYIRPVNWVLVSKDRTVHSVLLISQYEVNQCFDMIQNQSSRVTLVVYEPRVTRAMSSIDSCPQHPLPGIGEAWCNLSGNVRQDLHFFAGQLYFTVFQEYEQMVRALASGSGSTTAAPLGLLKEWIGIRRKGQNYLQTHIGQVTSGRVLHREMFEAVGDDQAIVEKG
ncbi:MAG: hypothetical protein Q9200_005403 [Gallowayella weberi]